MDPTQMWTIIAVNAGMVLTVIAIMMSLFLWNRSESRSDYRMLLTTTNEMKRDAAQDRKEMLQIIKSIEQEIADFHKLWAQESKDFHGRLCAIEEKRNAK